MRWIRIQGAAVVVMLATIHQVRHSVLHGTQVATLGKRYDVYRCNAGPQKLISVVDVFVLDGPRCRTVGGVINCAQHIRPIGKECPPPPECSVVFYRVGLITWGG